MSVLSQRAPPAQKKADDRLILFAIALIMGLLILLSAIASRASYRPGAAWTNPYEELFSKIKYPAFSGISKIQNTKMPHLSLF